jgi:hypothetical protein
VDSPAEGRGVDSTVEARAAYIYGAARIPNGWRSADEVHCP